MKAIELLSPAGAYPILKAVIGAGADAVYVGGPAFGARAYADNFSKEELLEASKNVKWKSSFLTICFHTTNRD